MIQSHTLANGKVLRILGNTVLAGYQINVAACRNNLGMYGGFIGKDVLLMGLYLLFLFLTQR